MLVEPDRDGRADAQDQPVREPRLDLRQWPRSGLVHAAERTPAVREVAIEVDAVRIAARVARSAVGIEHGDDPEVNAGRRVAREQLRNSDPAGLVAVNATDHEDGNAVRVTGLDQLDGTAERRPAEKRLRRPRGRREREDRQRGTETSRAPPAAPTRGSSVT